jgi:hypothetical protein
MSKKCFSFISLATFIFVGTITFDSLSHIDDFKHDHENIECLVCFNDVVANSTFEVVSSKSDLDNFKLNIREYFLVVSFKNFHTRAPPNKLGFLNI